MTALVYALTSTALLLFLLGVRRRKAETHWTAYRTKKEADAPQEIRDLIAAGVTVTPGQLFLAGLAGALLGLVGAYAVTGKAGLALLGLTAGFFAPRAWVNWRIGGRRRLFETQFEQSLGHMAAALRAGANIDQAWEQAALNAPPPTKEVLERVVLVARTRSLNIALEETAELVKSRDLKLAAAATALCRQTGGDLAAVYDSLADAIRERKAFRAQVDAALAEGKLSANVLAALPLGFIALFRWMSPEYTAPLFNTPKGLAVFFFCVGMIVAGWFVIRKMVAVEE